MTSWNVNMTDPTPAFTTAEVTQVPIAQDDSPILSKEQQDLASSIQEPLRYIFFAICVPLALCNIIVFTRKDMRSAPGTYVIALNGGQLLYVVLHTLDDIWGQLKSRPYGDFIYCAYLWYVSEYLGIFVSKRGSYLVLCLAAVERLYAVFRPLYAKTFVLSKRPVLYVSLAYLVVALAHAPNLVAWHVVMVPYPDGALCRVMSAPLYFLAREFFSTLNVAQKAIFEYASLAFQLTLNVLIVLALRRHNRATKRVNSSADDDTKRKQERQLTAILLGASVSHLIFSLPSGLFNLYIGVNPDFGHWGRYASLYQVLQVFIFNMNILGCGVDFFCFLALSKKFRSIVFGFVGLLTRGVPKPPDSDETQSSTVKTSTGPSIVVEDK